jgi:hypothetical protein
MSVVIYYIFANGVIILMAYISYVVFYTTTFYHSFFEIKECTPTMIIFNEEILLALCFK